MIDLMPGVVGWVIGKGGQRIKEMMAASQCRMWVDQDVPADEPRKLHLMVRTPKLRVWAMYRELLSMVRRVVLTSSALP